MKKEILNLIDEQIDQYFPMLIEDLKQICSIASGHDSESGTYEIVTYLLKRLEDLPIKSEIIKGEHGTNLIVRFNPGKGNKVILNAHLDTVFTVDDLNEHPVKADGDLFYGLGVSDCKGGAVMAIYILIIAYKNRLLQEREYELILGCDEEIGSPTSTPIYINESHGAKYALVFEPARENKQIIVSRRSCANAFIEVYGKAAHSANYTQGVSAVVGLSNIIQKMNQLHDPKRGIYVNCGCIESKAPINQVADYASMKVTSRVADKQECNEIFAKYKLACDPEIEGCKAKITFDDFVLPMQRDEKNLNLFYKASQAADYLHLDIDELSVSGTGDSATFSNCGLATIDGLGAYTYGMHVKDEHTSLQAIKERLALVLVLLQLID